jgi:DNA modification methylase
MCVKECKMPLWDKADTCGKKNQLAFETMTRATLGPVARGPRRPVASKRKSPSQLQLLALNGNGSGFRDPAFAENKVQPIHRWVPWIAGYSSKFVEDCLKAHLRSKSTREGSPCVLDPFAGVGTTLFTAVTNGYDTVGFEINPWAALACEVKLRAPIIEVKRLGKYLSAYESFTGQKRRHLDSLRPEGFKSRIPFFSPAVEQQVLTFLDFVRGIRQPEVADIFRVAFGSVMVSFSNYTYEPSLGSRPGAGKPLIDQADVRSIILRKLNVMRADIVWLQEKTRGVSQLGSGRIFNMDFMDCESVLNANSIDLMVTSPPYMNNYHYVRNTRPQLFWLSYVSSSDQLRTLEEHNLGKSWQAVRGRESVHIDFDHPGIERILNRLSETRRDRGAYGGRGWANYVTAYFNDSFRFLKTLKRVLRRGGIGVIVIGNSIIQGHEIKTEVALAELAEEIGLEVKGVQCVRSKRVGASITNSSVRRGESNRAILYESTVTLRKR